MAKYDSISGSIKGLNLAAQMVSSVRPHHSDLRKMAYSNLPRFDRTTRLSLN